MQQLPGMTQGIVSQHLRGQPLSSDDFPDNTVSPIQCSVYTTRDFSHCKWIRVSSGQQSATLQKHRANPSLSGTLLVPSRPRHEVTISSSNLCNQQGAAYRLEPRTALVHPTSEYNTGTLGSHPGTWTIPQNYTGAAPGPPDQSLFLIQTDLLPRNCQDEQEPEEAAIPSKGPSYQRNPCPRSSHCGLRDQQRALCAKGTKPPRCSADFEDSDSKAGVHHSFITCRHHPANLRNMLTATILGGCTGTEGGTLNLEHYTWVCSWKSAAL